jgi:nucleotide-binding universal stress UspA family protein
MKTLIAAVDFSGVTEGVLAAAAELALQQDGHLYLVHVTSAEPDFVGYEPGPEYIRDGAAAEVRELHTRLRALKDGLGLPKDRATALLVDGAPAEKILEEQARLGAGLIVIGSHGHGALHSLLVGSVTDQVLRKAPCPVLVVPALSAHRADGSP